VLECVLLAFLFLQFDIKHLTFSIAVLSKLLMGIIKVKHLWVSFLTDHPSLPMAPIRCIQKLIHNNASCMQSSYYKYISILLSYWLECQSNCRYRPLTSILMDVVQARQIDFNHIRSNINYFFWVDEIIAREIVDSWS